MNRLRLDNIEGHIKHEHLNAEYGDKSMLFTEADEAKRYLKQYKEIYPFFPATLTRIVDTKYSPNKEPEIFTKGWLVSTPSGKVKKEERL